MYENQIIKISSNIGELNITNIFNNINVKDYGAIGNGINNDFYSIQKAIDYANSLGGGTIYIPKGIYIISETIKLYKNCHLMGDGQFCSIIKLKNNTNKNMLTNYDSSVSFAKISNLVFDGNSTNQTEGNGIHFVDITKTISDEYLNIENLKIINIKNNGVYIGTEIRELRATNIIINNCGNSGMSLFCTDSYFNYCTVSNAKDRGYNVQNGANKFSICKAFFCGDNYETDNLMGDGFFDNGICNQYIGCESQENFKNGFTFSLRNGVGVGLVSNSNGRGGENIGYAYEFILNSDGYNIQGNSLKASSLNHNQMATIKFSPTSQFNYVNLTHNSVQPHLTNMLYIDGFVNTSNTVIINGVNCCMYDYIVWKLIDENTNGIVDFLTESHNVNDTVVYSLDYNEKAQLVDVQNAINEYTGAKLLSADIPTQNFSKCSAFIIAKNFSGNAKLRIIFKNSESEVISSLLSSTTSSKQEYRLVSLFNIDIPENTVNIAAQIEIFNNGANLPAKCYIKDLRVNLY